MQTVRIVITSFKNVKAARSEGNPAELIKNGTGKLLRLQTQIIIM